MVRHKAGGRRYVFRIASEHGFSDSGRAFLSESPPHQCDKHWPAGWEPLFAEQVRPDLFKAGGRDGLEPLGHDTPTRSSADVQDMLTDARQALAGRKEEY